MEEVLINAHDGYRLLLNVYEIENAKGVVQIAHGMEEHQGRYKAFAEMLNANGYTVVSADMRGHGKMPKTLGFFKRKEGYKTLAEIIDTIAYQEFNHARMLYTYLQKAKEGIVQKDIVSGVCSKYAEDTKEDA